MASFGQTVARSKFHKDGKFYRRCWCKYCMTQVDQYWNGRKWICTGWKCKGK